MSDFCYGWPILSRVFRQSALMDRMMAKVGASPAVAVRVDRGMAWYEARTRCIECTKAPVCQRWLEGVDSAAAPSEFCPNATFFRACAGGDAAPARQPPLALPM